MTAKPSEPSDPSGSMPSVTTRVDAVLAQWRNLRSSHVPVSFGCSCGLPVSHISVEEFESDLLDFIEAGWSSNGESGATTLGLPSDRQLETFLLGLNESKAPQERLLALLGDIEKSVSSFAPAAHVASSADAE